MDLFSISFSEMENAHLKLTEKIFFTGRKYFRTNSLIFSLHINKARWNYVSLPIDEENSYIQILDYFKFIGRSPSFLAHCRYGDDLIPQKIRGVSFDLSDQESWMAIDIKAHSKSIDKKDLKIVHVINFNQFMDYYEVLCKSFNFNDNKVIGHEYKTALAIPSDIFGGRVSHYVGYLNRKPVACSSLFIDSEFAGLYCLGVIPEYRGSGYSLQMHHERIKAARNKGCKWALLQAARFSVAERNALLFGFTPLYISGFYMPSKKRF